MRTAKNTINILRPMYVLTISESSPMLSMHMARAMIMLFKIRKNNEMKIPIKNKRLTYFRNFIDLKNADH
jgi:hypothetical protein